MVWCQWRGRAAVNRGPREGAGSFCQWPATAEQKPGVPHGITKPPQRREDDLAAADGARDCPRDIVDAKAAQFETMWTCEGTAHGAHTEVLKELRRWAEAAEVPFSGSWRTWATR